MIRSATKRMPRVSAKSTTTTFFTQQSLLKSSQSPLKR
jgi:hypothetical protein